MLQRCWLWVTWQRPYSEGMMVRSAYRRHFLVLLRKLQSSCAPTSERAGSSSCATPLAEIHCNFPFVDPFVDLWKLLCFLHSRFLVGIMPAGVLSHARRSPAVMESTEFGRTSHEMCPGAPVVVPLPRLCIRREGQLHLFLAYSISDLHCIHRFNTQHVRDVSGSAKHESRTSHSRVLFSWRDKAIVLRLIPWCSLLKKQIVPKKMEL